MNIAVFGTIFVDIKGYPLGTFIPDGRNAGYIRHVHGGVGRNVAEDIAHLGLGSRLVSLVDHSALAQEVLERLKENDVDTRFIWKKDSGMGTWMAIFDDTGDVAANISVRCDMTPLGELIPENENAIFEDVDSIVVEIDIQEEAVREAFAYGRRYGKKIFALVSNMGIALERKEYFPYTECFICNRQEARMLADRDTEGLSIEEMEALAAEMLPKYGFQKLIVTLGGEGAVYAQVDGETGFCPALLVELKDSTGAGDAFCAGAAAALTLGKDLKTACSVGAKTAAAVITRTENVCPVMEPEELR